MAAVQATDPSSNTEGLVVRDVNTSAIVSRLGSTLFVQLDPGHELGSIKGSNSSIAVYFDRGNPSVNINSQTSTLNVQLDPGHTLGKVEPGVGTFQVFLPDTGHTLGKVDAGLGTFNVQLDPGHTIGNIGTINSITNTVAVFFSPANPAVSATFSSASMEVVPTTGSRKTTDDAHAAQRVLIVGSQTAASLTINGTVTANAGTGTFTVGGDIGNGGTDSGNPVKIGGKANSSPPTAVSAAQRVDSWFSVHGGLLATPFSNSTSNLSDGSSLTIPITSASNGLTTPTAYNATYGFNGSNWDRVRVNSGVAAMALRVVHATDVGGSVQLMAGTNVVGAVNLQSTASIFTVSGSTSTAGNNTLVSPSASYNFKVYAYSIQTTGQVSLAPRFTTGASAGATELWRPLITASGVTGAQGANLAVPTPSFLFATGTNTTLSLYLDSATLVHYSVSYIKESA